MTAIVLPDIDRSTIEELKKRIPNLSEIELPTVEEVGKTAEQTIDRLLGRKRAPVWPWIAAAVTLAAVVGMVAAYFAWFRRPTWEAESDTWSTGMTSPDTTAGMTDDLTASPGSNPTGGTGLTAAETSLSSTAYPSEEA